MRASAERSGGRAGGSRAYGGASRDATRLNTSAATTDFCVDIILYSSIVSRAPVTIARSTISAMDGYLIEDTDCDVYGEGVPAKDVIPSPVTDYVRVAIDRSQGRSMVISSRGIVASENPLASQAGAMILARGGHAVDAAIAANAVIGLVEPMMNGVGGDLFAIVYENKTGQLHGVNASGWAPAALTPAVLKARGFDLMPQSGVHSVTVPGAVAGWALLRDRFGRKSFSEILAAAISLADEGFPVAEIIAAEWANTAEFLRADANAVQTYLPAGRAPRVGEIFRNPDLAWTYRQIAEKGRDGFYRDEIPRRIVADLEQRGGLLTLADLGEYTAEWVTPLSTAYRGWNVYEIPPNGSGIAALMMLNILEHFPLKEHGHNSVDALHAMIEAKKLAYADLQRHVADPEVVSRAHGRHAVEGLRARPRAPDRQGQSQRKCSRGHASGARRRYDIPLRGRSRGEHGIAHPEQLCDVWIGRGGQGDRVRAAEPGRDVHAGSRTSQRARAAQAAAPHHPSGVHEPRRRRDCLRHHGWLESIPGARPVHFERRRPRHEHSSCARGGAFHETHVHRV